MKILVIGLDGAAPELLFGDERLANFRRLMEYGCYGLLQGAAPPTPTLAWICMATSQGPDSLRGCGQPDRTDRSCDGSQTVDSGLMRERTIWEQVMHEGGRAILVDVPPSFPPPEIDGISVSFSVPVGSTADICAHPASVHEEIVELIGEYPVIADDLGSGEPESIRDQVRDLSRKHFAVVRQLMCNRDWEYFQYVESGLARLHHGISRHRDPHPVLHKPGSLRDIVIRDYYRFLDGELGSILEALDEDTIILVVCLHAAQRHDQVQYGAFVLAAPSNPLQGEVEGAHLLDIAPTLLELGGYDVPISMQGKSLVADQTLGSAMETGLSVEDEEILRERLSGLGYIS